MKFPNQPSLLTNTIGFGKFSKITIKEIYSGSESLPQAFIRGLLKVLFDMEMTPNKFVCNDINLLQKEFLFSNVTSIDNEIIHKTLYSRWDKLFAFGSENWSKEFSEDSWELNEELEHEPNALRFDESRYYGNTSIGLTNINCQLLNFYFIKDYIITAPHNIEELWLNEDSLNYFEIVSDIIEKEFGELQWRKIFEMKSVSPGIMDVMKYGVELSGSIQRYLLLFGSPTYIDWALRETAKFFLHPEDLDLLEASGVMCYPVLKVHKVSSDITKWEISRPTYNFEFSKEAKACNNEKYLKFTEEMKSYDENELREYLNDINYEPRYSDQDLTDDAFGGEASAYWNVD